MSTIKVKKKHVMRAYREATENVRQSFESIFGQELFREPKCIMKRVKSYEDACRELCEAPHSFKGLRSHVIAYIKLDTIARALNEGWQPDWRDRNQHKWYPWFNNGSFAGFASSNAPCVFTSAREVLSSYLCFPTKELAEYFVKNFTDIWDDYLLFH